MLDRAAGALTAPTLPAVAPPATLPNAVTMRALTGGGAASGSTVTRQQVLVETTVDAVLGRSVGARLAAVLRLGHSDDTSAAPAAAGWSTPSGAVRVVVRLADGAVTPLNRMGLDVLMVTGTQAVRYPEVRLERPAPIGGSMVALPAASGTVVACETGQSFTGGVPGGRSGVGRRRWSQLSSPPALIDPASIPVATWNATTIAATLTSGDTLQLTEPAWKGWRGGETAAVLGGTAAATEILRTGLTRLIQVGSPLPTQSRDEVAAAVLTATVADGLVAVASPPSGCTTSSCPHQSGHPGAPGDDERHGAGARLRGPAVVGLAEILRERVAGTTAELAVDATTRAADARRSDRARVVGSDAADRRLRRGGGARADGGAQRCGCRGVPVRRHHQRRPHLAGRAGGHDPRRAPTPAATSVQRALNRRLLGAGRGYREGATALAASFARAQDFVYIETPALDALAIGKDDATLNVWQVLVTRVS